ncbi:putative glycosyl transferase [Stanieria sp. NIES-3757]|nr:putative glycosyl transferase [Stanieria sp. NIES-3757]
MSYPRLLLVQGTANSNSLNAAVSLSEIGLLNEVVTTLAYDPKGNIAKYIKKLPKKIGNTIESEFNRRIWNLPQDGLIRRHIGAELLRLTLVKLDIYKYIGLNPRRLIDWVYFSLDSHTAKKHLNNIDAVYGYEDEVATTFEVAKKKGIICLYDLPIMFYQMSRNIQAQEAELFPDLSDSLMAVNEPSWKIKRKEKEIQLADHIFVASSITKRSVLELGISSEKISVIPYGAPIDYFQPQTKLDRKFRALYVGRLSPRKGVHYLLKAWQELKLPNAELLFVGSNLFPHGWLDSYAGQFRHISSVSHVSLNQYYSSGSVLVFPSLVEGFGLVLTEAMACGIPVITTPNTAGPDIITDGVEGFIIPIRDVEALKEKLEWCYKHPEELAEMGKAARRKAEQLTWDLYRQRLANRVQEILAQHQKV